MAKQFFKDLPDTTTPLTASRLNGLLDGEEALGNIVVDSIKTTNLLNPNSLISGTVSASDGSYSYVNYVVVSDYIPVKANKPYTIKLNNITNNQFLFRIILYTTSKVYSSTLHTGDELTEKTFTPAIDGYVRICFGMNGYVVLSPSSIALTNPQFEQNSSATAYKPFIEFGTDNFKNEEMVVGSIRSKNIFSFNYEVTDTSVTHRVVNNSIVQTNTGAYARSNWKITGLEIGTTYNFSCNYTNSNSCSMRISIYNSTNTTLITETSTTTNTSGNFSLTFTATETSIYIRFYTNTTSSGNTNIVTFSEIQLEEGSKTPYSPHQNLDGMENYSIDETIIGTFLGKPLYRKVLDTTNYATSYNISINNIDKIIKISGMVKRSDYDIWQFIPSRLDNASFSTQFGNVQYNPTTATINISFGTAWSSSFSRLIVILEYTKTTD